MSVQNSATAGELRSAVASKELAVLAAVAEERVLVVVVVACTAAEAVEAA